LSGWRPNDDGAALFVRLTPNASKDDITGWEAGADGQVVLAVRVRAVPEKGKANAALVKLLAKRMGIGKTRLEVAKGTTSRIKTVQIACESGEAEDLIGRLTGAGA